MKSELPRLLSECDLDVALVLGPDGMSGANPIFRYLTGVADHLTGILIVHWTGRRQLIHGTMERDAARKTGLELINRNRWPMHEILKKYPQPLEASVEFYRRIFADLKIHGRVAFYGTGAIGAHHALLQRLQAELPGVEIACEFERDIFQLARETKDAAEIETMRQVGETTCQIVKATVKFLQSHEVRDERLVHQDGRPLTIGEVKNFIRMETLNRGLEEPEGHIFALGRDAGVPHNVGVAETPLVLGQTIVFDIYPRRSGGYYHDMTRTFCLGYAPPEIERAYRDVLECFEQVVTTLQLGQPTQTYQLQACDFFEARGRRTIRSDPKAQSGYIHGLGHGLGLELHEQPSFPTFGEHPELTLRPGMVFTIEPGLYYPEQGFGIRLEDTYCCDQSGEFHSLTPYPKELVIPLKAKSSPVSSSRRGSRSQRRAASPRGGCLF